MGGTGRGLGGVEVFFGEKGWLLHSSGVSGVLVELFLDALVVALAEGGVRSVVGDAFVLCQQLVEVQFLFLHSL